MDVHSQQSINILRILSAELDSVAVPQSLVPHQMMVLRMGFVDLELDVPMQIVQ